MTFNFPPRPPASPFHSFVCAWKLTRQIHGGGRYWQTLLIKCPARALTAMFNHRIFSAWVAFLLQPENLPYAKTNCLLWHRTLLGYLSTRWSADRQLKVLQDTYRFAQTHPGPANQTLLYQDEITVAKVTLGEETGTMRITLGQDQRFRREGEWTLRVFCDKIGGELCSVALAVEEVNGQWVAYVGAIQGGRGANEETIKASWKAMHGVRAKAMGIFAVQEVVSALGISRLLGAGNTIQMSSAKHMIRAPWNKISFNYDTLWTEADGKAVEDGWFELPTREIRRTREETKTNKRALYARRYALFDLIQAAVDQSLGTR